MNLSVVSFPFSLSHSFQAFSFGNEITKLFLFLLLILAVHSAYSVLEILLIGQLIK